MRHEISQVYEDKSRMLFWVKIEFINDSSSKITSVYAAASVEYLSDLHGITSKQIGYDELKDWENRVVEKWFSLGEALFKGKIYYDTYANTKEGEANIMDFLVKLTTNIKNG